jgi:hypothetical protein
VNEFFAAQVGRRVAESSELLGGVPTLIGEFGLPFDLNDGAAYVTGDWSLHAAALSAYYDAMDENLVGATLWNYTADNSNERGDLWNGEDLSVFSRDQQVDPDDIHSGGRALDAVVRPYASRIAGRPLEMHFDRVTRVFELSWEPDTTISAPTEVFVPNFQYPNGYEVEIEGEYVREPASQILRIPKGSAVGVRTVLIKPAG